MKSEKITSGISMNTLSNGDAFVTFKIQFDLDEIVEQIKTNMCNDNLQTKDIKNFMLEHPDKFKECLKILQNIIYYKGSEECFDNTEIQDFCYKNEEEIERFKIATKSKYLLNLKLEATKNKKIIHAHKKAKM